MKNKRESRQEGSAKVHAVNNDKMEVTEEDRERERVRERGRGCIRKEKENKEVILTMKGR